MVIAEADHILRTEPTPCTRFPVPETDVAIVSSPRLLVNEITVTVTLTRVMLNKPFNSWLFVSNK